MIILLKNNFMFDGRIHLIKLFSKWVLFYLRFNIYLIFINKL